MKKQSKLLHSLKIALIVIFVLPLFVSWIPQKCYYNEIKNEIVVLDAEGNPELIQATDENGDVLFEEDGITPKMVNKTIVSTEIKNYIPVNLLQNGFFFDLMKSFQELSITLVTTVVFAMLISIALGYLSVLSMGVGRFFNNIMNAIESVPSILIALFCYAPVSGALVSVKGPTSTALSLAVFVAAATATVLPEAVRSISIPLSDLYNRKYSVSFRSYGFSKNRILAVLMKTTLIRDTLNRVAAGILLKTLVLDTSFGYVIQVGLGSTGTPQHTSPGALIAANRKAIIDFASDVEFNPWLFWIPSLMLLAISIAFLIILNETKEDV